MYQNLKEADVPEYMDNLIVDRETVGGYRIVNVIYLSGGFDNAEEKFKTKLPIIYKDVVQFVNPDTGETTKGPKFDTTEQTVKGRDIHQVLKPGVRQKDPIEPSQVEPRDRFQENKHMNTEKQKFQSLVKQCILEIKQEADPRYRLKESLRGVIKQVLKEISSGTKPEADKDEKEKVNKGYAKSGNERLDKANQKLQKELETIVHGINADWDVYWDDRDDLVVLANNLLCVRITPKFENNFDIDAMVKLVDRVRVIAVTWEQVKDFVKANFSDLVKTTKADDAKTKALDHKEDREIIKKDAGPEGQKVKVRYQDPAKPSVKDTKRDDKNYNEPQTKREEDMPDQPMNQVTDPGKDPDSKNKNIEKTPQVKPPKHKKDDGADKLKTDLPTTKKFRLRNK